MTCRYPVEELIQAANRKYAIQASEIERIIHEALSTYSNVHRGMGHYSFITEKLMHNARETVLEYLGLNKNRYIAVFCSPIRCEQLISKLKDDSFRMLSSADYGLYIGLRVVAIDKRTLQRGFPHQSGGGTVKMVSSRSVVWEDAPQRFEAGTPSIINSIVFASLLSHIKAGQKVLPKPSMNSCGLEEHLLYKDKFMQYSGRALLRILQRELIGKNTKIPVQDGTMGFVNLDNAASTPTFTPVYDAVCRALHQPEVSHLKIIEEVKKICSVFLGATLEKYELIFTSNTTEAINIASENYLRSIKNTHKAVIVNSILEHNSNELPWRKGRSRPLRVPLDGNGLPSMEYLERMLIDYNELHRHRGKRIRLVAMSGVSNILGSFNDIRTISSIAHKYGAYTLIDGAQSVAHRSINLDESGIDCFAFSGHKIYAPFGTGVLIIKKDHLNIEKERLDKIKASGEENLIGIVALGKAIDLVRRIGIRVIESHEKSLVESSIKGMKKVKGIRIYGKDDPANPEFYKRTSLISFTIKTIPHNLIAKKMAEYGGIGVRSGCLCSHLLVKHLLGISNLRSFTSTVLLTLIPERINHVLPGIVRISFGLENTIHDVDHFLSTLNRIIREPLGKIHRYFAFIYSGSPFLKTTKIQEDLDELANITVDRPFSPNRSI